MDARYKLTVLGMTIALTTGAIAGLLGANASAQERTRSTEQASPRTLPPRVDVRRINVPLFASGRTLVDASSLSTSSGLPVMAAGRVALSPLLLTQLRSLRNAAATSLTIALDDGTSLTKMATLRKEGTRTHITSGGTLADDYYVSLVHSSAGLRGLVFANGNTYSIWPGSNGTEAVVAQINPALIPSEEEPTRHTSNRPSSLLLSVGVSRQALVAGPHVHRVLIVYTDDVDSAHPAAANGLYAAVDMANQTYRNSQIRLRLEAAAVERVDYEESGKLATDLNRLKATNDGFLDRVHALRDRHAADLVMLVVNSVGGGKANLHLVSSDADDDSAFAVMGFGNLSQSTFTHELGHIAGAHHNTGHDPFPVPSYAHGWTRPDQFGTGKGWRSTMAYATGECGDDPESCPRFPLAFSNPGIQVGGKPAGNATASNAKRIAETAQTLAGFRIDGPRISLYEGANGSQDHVCVVSVKGDSSTDFTTSPNPRNCDNDEARSAKLFDAPAGRTIRLFDSPQGSRQDDWIEITTKRAIGEKLIGSFERSFEDADVRVVFHRNDGLNGKVSRLEASSLPSGPHIVLYEGNNSSQNLVCALGVGQSATVRFPEHPDCDNDEARSARLVSVKAGTVIRLFDSPEGSRDDDWTELVVEADQADVRIGTFERTTTWGRVRATHYRNNGLDGKVSRIEVLTGGGATGPLATLKEGNNGTQNTVCTIGVGQAQIVHFPGHPDCNEDEARSMILTDVPANITLLLFDNPDRRLDDDWVAIRTKRAIQSKTIGSFERSISDNDIEMVYQRNNGLDGKVSRLEVVQGLTGGIASLYEGNGAIQNKVCDLPLEDAETRFRGNGACDNDEARSLVLSLARAGTRISLYDSPDCRVNDDYTIIRVKRDLFRKVVSSFERSVNDTDIEVVYHRDNGLDGKVSCVRVEAP